MKALALLLLCGCINSPAPTLVPMPPREPSAAEWATELPRRIAQADGFAVATITRMDADWTYDDPCGFVTMLAHRCDGTVTYKLHLQPVNRDVYAFTLAYGTFGLFVGERALFVWRRDVVYRYLECRQHQGMGSYCNYDLLDILTSDLDVLPPQDSARVDSLRGHR